MRILLFATLFTASGLARGQDLRLSMKDSIDLDGFALVMDALENGAPNSKEVWKPKPGMVERKGDVLIVSENPAYLYLAQNKQSGDVEKISLGNQTIRCLCNDTGLCEPKVSGGLYLCEANGCVSCSMEIRGQEIDTTRYSTGGYFAINPDVHLFKPTDSPMPSACKTMFAHPPTMEALTLFVAEKVGANAPALELVTKPTKSKGIYKIAAPQGYKLALVQVAGRVAVIPISLSQTGLLKKIDDLGNITVMSKTKGSPWDKVPGLPVWFAKPEGYFQTKQGGNSDRFLGYKY